MSELHISKAAAGLPSSPVSVITQKADALAREGHKVIVFSIGRPDFDTPAHVKAAAADALEKGQVHYAHNKGILPLRQAIAAYIKKYQNIDYNPETEIMVVAGAQEGLMLSFHATLNPGEAALVPTPGFLLYYSALPLIGVEPVPYTLPGPDYRWKGADVPANARVLVVNSPNNPTGSVFSDEELLDIAALAKKHDLMVVSDEAYDRLVFGSAKHRSIAGVEGMRERTLLVGSFSKTFSMTGWRLGYVCGPAPIIESLARLQQNYMLCANTFAQFGAIAALNGPQDCVDVMHAAFDERRKILIEGLKGAPKVRFTAPEGAFYIFLDIRETGMDAFDFCRRLLDEAHVACVPGDDFGPAGLGHVRLSYATSAENCAEGARRIREFLSSL